MLRPRTSSFGLGDGLGQGRMGVDGAHQFLDRVFELDN
jgi:hypothetical protein